MLGVSSEVAVVMSDDTTDQSVTPIRRLVLPPVVLLAALALQGALDRWWPLAVWFSMPWKMLGWAPIVLGCVFCALGAKLFRRHRTTIRPFYTSDALVTTGVYGLSRNPMYLGMTLVLVGVAVIGGSVSVWIVPPLFVAAIQRRFIRAEEAMLSERFGEQYDRYRRGVRRWI